MNGFAICFAAREVESPEAFGDRLRLLASDLVGRVSNCSIAVLAADGHPDIPAQSFVNTMERPGFDGILVVTGSDVDVDALPEGDVTYEVQQHVVKASSRGTDGERTPGVTLVLAIVRAESLSREEFLTHWAEHHAPLHLRNSPASAWYEQLVVNEPITDDAPAWDGIGLIGYATKDLVDNLFADAEAEAALMNDNATFLDLPRVRALAASEYVYRA